MLHITEPLIYYDITHILKSYPDFNRLIEYHEPIRVKQPGWEVQLKEKITKVNIKPPDAITKQLSLKQTKVRLSDLILCNKFDYFCTFTFAKNRYDLKRTKKTMQNWLKSQSKQYGKFRYIIVPEFHKDKKALHFHALIADYKGNLYKTNIKQKGRTIYNIKSYRSGFTTAVKIDNHHKVSNYIKKYITKDMPHFDNKKRYWCSDNLIRPKKIINPDIHSMDFTNYNEVYTSKTLTIYSDKPILKELLT